MSFAHKTGTTDPEAPDEIVDWFSTFETWITGVGWTVQSGSGTTNLVLSSGGEAGGLTKLFMNVWRDGANPTDEELTGLSKPVIIGQGSSWKLISIERDW